MKLAVHRLHLMLPISKPHNTPFFQAKRTFIYIRSNFSNYLFLNNNWLSIGLRNNNNNETIVEITGGKKD